MLLLVQHGGSINHKSTISDWGTDFYAELWFVTERSYFQLSSLIQLCFVISRTVHASWYKSYVLTCPLGRWLFARVSDKGMCVPVCVSVCVCSVDSFCLHVNYVSSLKLKCRVFSKTSNFVKEFCVSVSALVCIFICVCVCGQEESEKCVCFSVKWDVPG